MNQRTSERHPTQPSAGASDGTRFRDAVLTVPNVLTLIRLAGAPVLIVLAFAEQPYLFLGLFLVLALTDWLDGKLAILLKQRTVLGARLDSWADATCYGALLIGAAWLRGDVLWHEAGWIGAALASYLATTAAGLWKFGRWPSYHTRAAKTSWLVVVIGTICLLGGWSRWPLRLAMVGVTLTNVEAVLITCISRRWHANVPSLYHAWHLARADAERHDDALD